MTLTNWFRAYFFNPFTRWLRKGERIPQTAILFLTQLATMILIGMWHGITWNFLIWGVWHGLGLFLQNRLSEWVKPLSDRFEGKSMLKGFLNWGGVLITFHYVTLGWIWFVLPEPSLAFSFFARLLGQG